MKQSILAIFALALLGCSHADVSSPGPCPNVGELQPNFVLEKFLGSWYAYANLDTGKKCVKAEYSLRGDGNVAWQISQVDAGTNVPSSSSGYAILVGNAEFKSISPLRPPTASASNYWILATDYTNYSVGYFCQPAENNTHLSDVWIFTRQSAPSAETVQLAEQVLVNHGISSDQLVVVNQSDC